MVGPENQVGQENEVGPRKKIGPENQVGPRNKPGPHYASVCVNMHPSRIRMHPYASIRLQTLIFSTHFCRKEKWRNHKKNWIAIRSNKSVRIQPNIQVGWQYVKTKHILFRTYTIYRIAIRPTAHCLLPIASSSSDHTPSSFVFAHTRYQWSHQSTSLEFANTQ